MNQQQYRELVDSLIYELYKIGDKEISLMYKLQKENRDKLLDQIAKVLLKLNVSDSALDLTTGDIKIQYTQLGDLIKDGINNEIRLEKDKAYNILSFIVANRYYINSYVTSLGLNFDLKKVDLKILKKIINEKVKGKHYSDRIWENKNDIAKMLQKNIKDFLEGKISVNDIEKVIKLRYNSNAYNTNRLLITEIARVQEESNNYWMSEHEVDYVLYSGTLDSKTCSDCGKYDGEVYEVDKKPISLPKHPKCRCTYIALPSKEWRPKNRMDNETKKIGNYKTYLEWKNKNNLK